MLISKRSLIVLAMAGAIAIPASVTVFGTDSATTSRRRPVTTTPTDTAPVKTPSPQDYLTTQLEHYLTDDGIAYIRPGSHIKLNSVELNAERQLVVDFNLMDDYDQPIDINGKMTPGPVSMGFILAWYNPETRQLVNYNERRGNADRDRTGTYTELELGHYVYTFGTMLPADFDMTKTHQLGVYARRDLRTEIGKRYYDNAFYEFRPDGGDIAPTDRWDKIRTEACWNCHTEDTLAAHGGTRRDVKMCAMCHNAQTEDANFPVMIHEIHLNTTFPQDIRNCANCHEGRSASQKPTQSDIWYTYPNRKACGSCHHDIDWVTGEGHAGGPQADDSACANCHVPESEKELDPSIKGAHTIPAKSKQLAGLNVEIVSVSDVAPGMMPTVVTKVTNGDGSVVDGSTLDNYRLIVAGPTTDYQWYLRAPSGSKPVFDGATGTSTFTFTDAIPADATGSVVVTGDVYRWVNIKDGQGNDVRTREAALNPIEYVALDGGDAHPRRVPAVINQCNSCHDRLAFHGGQRYLIEECVVCHNPTTGMGEEYSISFQHMIHRIHTGSDLTREYAIRGPFNEVEFPGDRRNCQKCHTSNGYLLPVPFGASPVYTPNDFWSPKGPGTTACLGCHDNQDAAAHAYLMTAFYPGNDAPAESCGSCHGSNATWSVDKVHAQ